jgi:hypothetical protein
LCFLVKQPGVNPVHWHMCARIAGNSTGDCGRVNGFSLGGRPELEPGLREAFSVAPVSAWDIRHHTLDAPLLEGNFDFLLEGVPNVLANREAASGVSLSTLQHNAALAGVLAFALAENPSPLGPRLSRAGVSTLLQSTGLEARMKAAGLWHEWESAQRGRQQ